MKNLKIIALFVVMTLFFMDKSFAVNGYKNLKFGMTSNQVMNSGICTFSKRPAAVEGADFYACMDFDFSGNSMEAGFFTVNGKFQRFYFLVPIDSAIAVINSLVSKYGPPSDRSTVEQFENVDNFPNRQAFYAFDKNTVYFQLNSLQDSSQIAMVVYTSPDYDSLRDKAIQKEIDDIF